MFLSQRSVVCATMPILAELQRRLSDWKLAGLVMILQASTRQLDAMRTTEANTRAMPIMVSDLMVRRCQMSLSCCRWSTQNIAFLGLMVARPFPKQTHTRCM